MKGCTKWSYAPYRPFLWNVGDVYICRVAPSKNAIHFEWLALEDGAEYEIFCRKRDEESFASQGKTYGLGFDRVAK